MDGHDGHTVMVTDGYTGVPSSTTSERMDESILTHTIDFSHSHTISCSKRIRGAWIRFAKKMKNILAHHLGPGQELIETKNNDE